MSAEVKTPPPISVVCTGGCDFCKEAKECDNCIRCVECDEGVDLYPEDSHMWCKACGYCKEHCHCPPEEPKDPTPTEAEAKLLILSEPWIERVKKRAAEIKAKQERERRVTGEVIEEDKVYFKNESDEPE